MKFQGDIVDNVEMPASMYHCKYCFQSKPTQTALNCHIAHSPECNQAWQTDLAKLSIHTMIMSQNATDIAMADPEDDIFIAPALTPTPPPDIHPSERPPRMHSVEMEEVEDVDDPRKQTRYKVQYPGRAAEVLGKGKTQFELWQVEQDSRGESKWAPFESQDEWDLAQWLMKNVGQKSIDEYLKLPIVSR